jgi:molecular chaperone GrpE
MFSDTKGTEEAPKEDPAAAEEEASPAVEEEPREIQLEKQVIDLKDQLLRSLAEQENTRRIAKRDVESARNFAIKSFAKSLLDTSDNLSLALGAVPEELRSDKEGNAVLANLYEGIQMTQMGLDKAFEQNGLKSYGEVGDVFDPNHHEALFQYPDPNLEAGTIGQVMKKGFFLNNRVLRPAEVGVIKN